VRPTRSRSTGPRNAGLLVAAVAVAGAVPACSPGGSTAPPPAPPAAPPPAACLLDTAALAAATGLTWTPNGSTASDTRCVYDPAGTPRPSEGPVFVTVDVAPAADRDPGAALDTVAALCEDGSRAPVGGPDSPGGDADDASDGGTANGEPADAPAGFVCRFQGGNVFAAVARDGRLVTLAASAVPPGTTAARLVMAFDQQVAALVR
jgi:hypothetical protein